MRDAIKCPFCPSGIRENVYIASTSVGYGHLYACSRCHHRFTEQDAVRGPSDSVALTIAPLPIAPSALAGLPRGMNLPSIIPESYSAGRHGAVAEVTMGGQDATILTEMGQVSALLQVLATHMNSLQGYMPSTRACIKACRNLSAEIQEEIEVRLGPKG